MLPLPGLALDPDANLHVVPHLGIDFMHEIPLGHARPWPDIVGFDLRNLRHAHLAVFATLVRLIVPLAGLLGAEGRLPNLPLARLVTKPAAHARVVRCIRMESIDVNAALGRLSLVSPFADFLPGAFANLYLENDFPIKLAEQTPTDLRDFVGGTRLDPGNNRPGCFLIPVAFAFIVRFSVIPAFNRPADRAENVLSNLPRPRFFFMPSPHSNIVIRARLQAVHLDFTMGGLGSMLPLTRLALDSRSQLDIVRQLALRIAHQLPPEDSYVRFGLALDPGHAQINLPAFAVVSFTVSFPFTIVVAFAVVSFTVSFPLSIAVAFIVVAPQGLERVLLDLPEPSNIVYPATNADLVKLPRLQAIDGNPGFDRLGSSIPFRWSPIETPA